MFQVAINSFGYFAVSSFVSLFVVLETGSYSESLAQPQDTFSPIIGKENIFSK